MKTKEQTIFDHKGETIKTEDREIDMIKKHEEPLIVVLENVLSDEECDTLIEMSKERIQRSKIATKEINEIRTSSGMFFERSENEFIAKIEKRISDIMCIPIEHAENLQVLNYQSGQEYKPHFDYFKSTSKAFENNRISTLVIYLNDVEEGGETHFPSLNLKIPPRKGSAVYFEYFYNDQNLNEMTLHSGNPVKRGEKWAMTQWMRRKRLN